MKKIPLAKKIASLFVIVFGLFIFLSIPEMAHKNTGTSKSIGKVSNGALENGYLIPFRKSNFSYFSFWSYFMMNNAYLHSRVHKTVLDAYKSLANTEPSKHFYIMECADKKGGKLSIHKTHQNGLSVDFMVPKKGPWPRFNHIGMFHYLLEFDNSGNLKLNKKVNIDFDLMAKHILALDDAAKSNKIRINKVILKIELKDDLFSTPNGKILKSRNIYFAKSLDNFTNKVHDDHYHIDFSLTN